MSRAQLWWGTRAQAHVRTCTLHIPVPYFGNSPSYCDQIWYVVRGLYYELSASQ